MVISNNQSIVRQTRTTEEWYAICGRSKFEAKVEGQLENVGLIVFSRRSRRSTNGRIAGSEIEGFGRMLESGIQLSRHSLLAASTGS